VKRKVLEKKSSNVLGSFGIRLAEKRQVKKLREEAKKS
jgi:hypothetical protein